MNPEQIGAFQQMVWQYYAKHGRHSLPWRLPEADGSFDPYKIMVSEVMLQQTQVGRITLKFNDFLQLFPTVASLAGAPLAAVLRAWSGLGYNRRAKFLWQAARMVAREYGGQIPHSSEQLVRLPGIGPNTAGAIMAYAYNSPVVFVETNIRTAFLHYFFAGQHGISDKDIIALLLRTVKDNPRQWYWALMDYGAHLKQTVGNPNRASAHYTKQSAFEGSRRQIRGQVLRLLGEGPRRIVDLSANIHDGRLPGVLDALAREGFIQKNAHTVKLADNL